MSFLKNKIKKYREVKEKIDEEDLLDLDMAEEPESLEEEKEKLWTKLGRHRRSIRKHRLLFIGVFCLLLISGLLFLYLYVGTDYSVLSREERSDISGTIYTEFGENFLKCSSDGVTCLAGSGSVLWNSTFNMQSPMINICGTTAAVADQQGTQIHIFNESGQIGQFQTSLPIEKVRVARQGVVAAVLSDGDVTWINFYDSQGKEIAKTRTSLGEYGYPLDVALSPDGMKILVSYLRVTQGIMNTRVCFYNFDSVGQTELNNMVTEQTYDNTVAPEVFFIDQDMSVVLLSNGFSLFKGRQVPEQKKKVEFESEILSAFHDGEYFGFIFKSDKEEHKYKMLIYNAAGRQVAKTYFDLEYKQVKLRGGRLILFNDRNFEIYNTRGRRRFSGTYDKAIQDIIKVKGFQKYVVLTQNHVTTVRLK